MVTRSARRWSASDLDVEEYEDMHALAAALHDEAGEDGTALAVIEREDSWWALVRVDAGEDPRVFVSDAAGVASGKFAALLATDDDDEASGPAGDPELMTDLRVGPAKLRALCDEESADALTAIAEAAGFAEVIDSLR